MGDQSNKTEKATPRKTKKARREGNFPNTKLLVSGVQFAVFVALLVWQLPKWFGDYKKLTVVLIQRAVGDTQLGISDIIYLTHELLIRSLSPLVIGGAVLVLLSLLTQLFATGFGLSTKNLTPNFEKLDPTKRIKSMFGENIQNLGQALVMLPIFFYVAYVVCSDNIGTIVTMPLSQFPSEMLTAGNILRRLLWNAAIVLTVFGFVAYAYQRHRYAKQLKMSRQEVIDEHKEIEGNPMVRARRRSLQRDMRRRGMLQQVATATAVIVNPTHYAVALRYEMDSKTAPVVVAKGQNFLALRIRQAAEQHNIPIVENKPLAQALYRSAEIGQEIPMELYRAVAEVLAYVYQTILSRAG
jgi:flagellar biosynthesis protein FlhB